MPGLLIALSSRHSMTFHRRILHLLILFALAFVAHQIIDTYTHSILHRHIQYIPLRFPNELCQCLTNRTWREVTIGLIPNVTPLF